MVYLDVHHPELNIYQDTMLMGEPALLAGLLALQSASSGRKLEFVAREFQPTQEDQAPEIIPVGWPIEIRQAIPEVYFRPPLFPEEIIQSLPFVGGDDLLIALFKGNQGNDALAYREERLQLNQFSTEELMRYIRRRLNVVWANDVMSTIWVDRKEQVEHKPEPDETKEQIWVSLWKKMGVRPQDDPEGTVTSIWKASSSLHALDLDVQVVRRVTHEVVMKRASISFLNALIFGVEDAEHPVDTETRESFLHLYADGTSYSTPAFPEKPWRHEKNLFGWTPEEGMPLENLRSINGGRKGDSIFLMELLVTQIDGVRKEDPRFAYVAPEAIRDVNGRAVHLPYMLRRLVEIVASFKTLADVENFRGDERFRELAQQYNAVKDQYPDLVDKQYSGRTVDLSGEYEPIDWKLYLAFAQSVLGLPGIDIVTSDIIL